MRRELLFQGFCFLKYAENDLKMRCQNVKLFLREPLSVSEKNKCAGLRRILVRMQGASASAY